MRNLCFFAFFLLSLSAYSQTDPLKTSADSLRSKQVQDSLKNIELQEGLKALLFPDSVKPTPPPPPPEPPKPQVSDSLKIKQAQDSLIKKNEQDNLRSKQIQDSLRNKQIQDSIKVGKGRDSLNLKSVQDTLKPKLLQDSIKPKLVEDSIKPKLLSDSIRPKLMQDSIKPKVLQDSIRPKPLQDSIKPKPLDQSEVPKLLPDSLSPKELTDSLTPDQILQYYMHEPEPIQFYKGPDVGDSVFYVLNPLTIPTKTVEGYALSMHGDGSESDLEELDTVNYAEQRLKPKISFGYGSLGFKGDLYQKHFQSPTIGRSAFDLAISQRMTRYLQLDFNVLFGKLGANEMLNNRHENFQSEIRAGGVNILYDFGNFIPDRFTVRPYVSFGVCGFEFLSKTDLKDRNGNTYYYWSDGSIKDKAEGSADAQYAKNLVRDYKYESDIRELNKDGFGKYAERSWAFPLGVGFVMKVTDRIDMKLNFQYYFSMTDYIDGISNKSVGDRIGTKQKDNFTYTSFALQYDLISKYRSKHSPYMDTLTDAFWLAFDNEDMDDDSIPDMQDDCQGTAKGARVDAKGCPLDGDNDGIPDYRDDEPASAPGVPVNKRGVAQSDAYWKTWYDQYLNDTIPSDRTTEYTGNIYAATTKKPKQKKENFTVELVRYSGSIPSDELAFLLSIGDINSTTLDDGTTVVYTTGSYDKLGAAIKRRDEFRTEGNKAAGISRIQGKEIVQVTDEELQKLLNSELEELLSVNVGDSNSVNKNNPLNPLNPIGELELNEKVEETFTREDIVYRVQLGAFKNKISTSVFNTSAGVLELKTGENVFRYVTKGYKTIEDAAAVRADLVVQGYSDAFVTAYKGGKRIPMNQTKATMDKNYKEDLREDIIFNSIDKKLLAFKVQLGPLKKMSLETAMDEKVKDLPNIEKQTTTSGNIRYSSGSFQGFDAAEKHRKQLEDKGFTDAFIIATFKNEVISIQEAMELLK